MSCSSMLVTAVVLSILCFAARPDVEGNLPPPAPSAAMVFDFTPADGLERLKGSGRIRLVLVAADGATYDLDFTFEFVFN